jgi:hypothetical protein
MLKILKPRVTFNKELATAYTDALVEKGVKVKSSIIPDTYKPTKDISDPFIIDVMDRYRWNKQILK